MGARHRPHHDVLSYTRGHAVTGEWGRIEKALCGPPRHAGGASAYNHPGLCRSARRTRLAAPHLGYRARTASPGWCTTADRGPRVPAPPDRLGAGLFGDALMLQLSPQSRIFLATEPVDFRKGIDGLAAVCRQVLGDNPLEGAVYVFRNRAGTALKLLLYDGQGYWLCLKRLSQGRFHWWPTSPDAGVPLSARELLIVLWNGNPDGAQMAQDWRRLA